LDDVASSCDAELMVETLKERGLGREQLDLAGERR
jgi:hypothetical protein